MPGTDKLKIQHDYVEINETLKSGEVAVGVTSLLAAPSVIVAPIPLEKAKPSTGSG